MRAHRHPLLPLFLGALFGFLLAGCATKVADNIKVPVGELALHESLSKKDNLAKLEEHLKEAANYNMPFLAPRHYREALALLKDIQNSSPRDASIYEFAKGDAILDKGDAVIDKVKSRLGKELDLKELLDKQNAKEIYSWRYESVINELSKLIEKVELDRAGNIEMDIKALNENMQALYDKTVEYTATHGSQPGDRDEMK